MKLVSKEEVKLRTGQNKLNYGKLKELVNRSGIDKDHVLLLSEEELEGTLGTTRQKPEQKVALARSIRKRGLGFDCVYDKSGKRYCISLSE